MSAQQAYCLEGADCELLIADAAYGSLVAAALAASKALDVAWTDATGSPMPAGALAYEAVAGGTRPARTRSLGARRGAASGTEVPERPADAAAVPDDAGAEMYYTSGTSGRPKGVVLSRRTVVLHALGCMIEHRIHSSDVWLHCAPMFHLVDAYAIFAVTWVAGCHAAVRVESNLDDCRAVEKLHNSSTSGREAS